MLPFRRPVRSKRENQEETRIRTQAEHPEGERRNGKKDDAPEYRTGGRSLERYRPEIRRMLPNCVSPPRLYRV